MHRTFPPKPFLVTELAASSGVDLGEPKCWGDSLRVYGGRFRDRGISRRQGEGGEVIHTGQKGKWERSWREEEMPKK